MGPDLSTAALVGLGLFLLLVVGVGLVVAVRMALQHDAVDKPPPSEPRDFVAPASAGGYRFRDGNESANDFHERVAREDEEIRRSTLPPPPSGR